MATYIIRNSAGGNGRKFRWDAAKGLTLTALRHAVACGVCGGPDFAGEASEAAAREYEDVHMQYIDGECSDAVTRIFQR